MAARRPSSATRAPLVCVLASAAFLFAACSSSNHAASTRSQAPSTLGAGAGSTTSVAGEPGSTTTSAAAPGSGAAAGSATTAPGKSGTPSPAPTAATGSNSQAGGTTGAPGPATAGTYQMDQSGGISAGMYSSSEPPQGTLVVDPAQANGQQVDHRYVEPNSSPANTTTQFLPSGPVILSTTEGSGSTAIACTFNPPIEAPPWPPAAGKTFSAQGNCGSGNTVTVQGRITGSQTATLKDGETFTVWVIDSTLTIHGQINASGTQVDWYAAALRLPVHEETHVTGSYSGFNFKLDSISDLVSSHPS